MQKAQSHINKGFSLIELLISVSIFLIFVIALSGTTSSVIRATKNATNRDRAVVLAEEGLEAVRNIRDSSNGFGNLPDGTYGLSVLGNIFSLSGSSDVSGIFTRVLNISTISGSQKKVISTISWADINSPTNSLSFNTYLTDWRAPLNIGLTVNKVVVGGSKVPSDFLPTVLSTTQLDNTQDPPVSVNVDIPIIFSPTTMTLVSGIYTFLTSSDPNYTISLSSSCTGNTIILSNGDAKICTITYSYNSVVPTVTSSTATSITSTTATLGANVTSLGMPASISQRGTCYSTSPNPTLTNGATCLAEGGTTTGVFVQARTGFIPGTIYYYAGYATNITGTGYSKDGSFTTLGGACAVTGITPTTYDNSSSTSAVVAKPTGVVQYDIMFAYVLHNSASDRLNSIPSGWSEIGRHRNGSSNQALFYKVAGASEPATYTFGLSANSRFAVTINAYRGCFDPATPIETSSNTEYVTNNTTYRAASLTLPTAYTTIIIFPSVNASGTKTFAAPLTQGGGWTQNYTNGNASSQFSRSAFSKMMTVSGATNVIDSIGFSASTGKHAFGVALHPL